MSILVDRSTRVVVQGITGREGAFHAARCKEYGTAIVGGVTPLKFQHRFKVPTPKPQVGVYTLTATINHSPTGNQNQLTEMFGFAESTPIQIVQDVVESN